MWLAALKPSRFQLDALRQQNLTSPVYSEDHEMVPGHPSSFLVGLIISSSKRFPVADVAS